jgi:hypothetical protein
MNPDPVEVVFREFDEDAEEVMKLTAFTSATSIVNLFLSTDEGLHMMNLLGAIIVGAEFVTGGEEKPYFKLLTNHKNLEVTFELENISAALWVNVQQEAHKRKEKIDASNADNPETAGLSL